MTFAQFFHALWDRDPFPWQEALAEKALQGEWPRRIGLPTASGKTALIDIAVYALAMRAPGASRRIFFVVDRRVIVDDAADRAACIKKKLAEAPPHSDLGKLSQSLRDLGGDTPLETATLRGGIPREDSWADSPLQPMVVCSTVDQVGSSLLFRAYGASEYARSIRAGLAACDSLILLDEAHTSRAFAQTLELIQGYGRWADCRIQLPFTVVEMSATPQDKALRETSADLENEVLRRRWQASKRARLAPVEPKEGEEAAKGGFTALVDALVQEARTLRDKRAARVIGVIANRVATARLVHDALSRDTNCDAILLTGRSRPYDRERIWQKWNDRIRLGRGRDTEQQPLFVVATQCIEVGANLDFDGLVTELASIDALEQRFGRLDRDGRHAEVSGATHAAIVAQKDQTAKKYEDILYGSAMPATWDWLTEHVTTETRVEQLPVEGKKKPRTRKVKDQFVEMGVRALRAALDVAPNRESLVKPADAAPVLMPAHVDLLSQTSPEPAISPEPSVYLHGPEAGPADVQVVWRADLDDDVGNWRDLVAACPPAAAEMLSVSLGALKQWFTQGPEANLADIEGGREENGRITGKMRPVLCWRGVDESEPISKLDALRPGMTLVVPSQWGGCDEWGWKPNSMEEVLDIGDPVKLLMERPMLRLHPALAAQWKYESLAEKLRGTDHPEFAQVVGENSPPPDAEPWIAEALKELRRAKPKWIDDPKGTERRIAVVSRSSFDQNDARGSYTNVEVPLAEHMENCGCLAGEFARELPERLRRTIVLAAELHDIGKADPRFQAWLRGGNPVKSKDLIAKSPRNGQNRAAVRRARELAGYPKHGRHELMSTAMLLQREDWPTDIDRELLLHLVASHHGRCRPFAPVVKDENPVVVEYGGTAVSSAHGLERVGSGVSERFWRLTRRYGWYGLAYLEAVVRLADQRQSEMEQKAAGKAANV